MRLAPSRVALFALLHRVVGPAVPLKIIGAIANGEDVIDTSTRRMGIAPPTALAETTPYCSLASPCWLGAKEKLEGLDGGTQLATIDSIKLLRYYTSGKGTEAMCPADEKQSNNVAHFKRGYDNLISDSLLFALWMVDPWSHAFWYSRDGRIYIVPPQARACVHALGRIDATSA